MKKPTYETAVRSHIGLVRERNEDSVDLAQLAIGRTGHGIVLTVADGMGGVSGGATASILTVQVVAEAIGRLGACVEPMDTGWQRRVTQWLRETASDANRMVRQLAQDQPSLKGMGTTLLLGVVIDGWMGLAWAGDSRAYLFRDATLVQLTRDHTWDIDREMEGRADDPDVLDSPYRGLLTSAVGQREVLESGVRWDALYDGDVLLLATDGLTRYYDGEALAGSIADDLAAGVGVDLLAERLIARANAAGGVDNTSVGVVRVGRLPQRVLPLPTLTTQTQVPPKSWKAPATTQLASGGTVGPMALGNRRRMRVLALALTSVLCVVVGVVGSVQYATGRSGGGAIGAAGSSGGRTAFAAPIGALPILNAGGETTAIADQSEDSVERANRDGKRTDSIRASGRLPQSRLPKPTANVPPTPNGAASNPKTPPKRDRGSAQASISPKALAKPTSSDSSTNGILTFAPDPVRGTNSVPGTPTPRNSGDSVTSSAPVHNDADKASAKKGAPEKANEAPQPTPSSQCKEGKVKGAVKAVGRFLRIANRCVDSASATGRKLNRENPPSNPNAVERR
ncbi:MAG: protein phosphatase 2C domain-containing protein [Gemmatimonas sp.]